MVQASVEKSEEKGEGVRCGGDLLRWRSSAWRMPESRQRERNLLWFPEDPRIVSQEFPLTWKVA